MINETHEEQKTHIQCQFAGDHHRAHIFVNVQFIDSHIHTHTQGQLFDKISHFKTFLSKENENRRRTRAHL